MVGDDREGGSGIVFGVRQGVQLELGFAKLFWSTDQLELNGIEQDSVFEDQEESPVVASDLRKVVVGEREEVKDWGTVLVTLVQRA